MVLLFLFGNDKHRLQQNIELKEKIELNEKKWGWQICIY